MCVGYLYETSTQYCQTLCQSHFVVILLIFNQQQLSALSLNRLLTRLSAACLLTNVHTYLTYLTNYRKPKIIICCFNAITLHHQKHKDKKLYFDVSKDRIRPSLNQKSLGLVGTTCFLIIIFIIISIVINNNTDRIGFGRRKIK